MKLDSIHKIYESFEKHSPEILIAVGVAGYIGSTLMVINRNNPLVHKALYQATGNKYYEIRYMQLTHSNNWLKMHGYPMRRKLRMRKKSRK